MSSGWKLGDLFWLFVFVFLENKVKMKTKNRTIKKNIKQLFHEPRLDMK